jgi:hypothetical protein
MKVGQGMAQCVYHTGIRNEVAGKDETCTPGPEPCRSALNGGTRLEKCDGLVTVSTGRNK